MERFKTTFQLLPVVLILFMVMACGSSEPGLKSSKIYSQNENNTLQTQNSMVGLDDYLRRFSGVIVRGTGPYAKIRIQGVESFLMTTDPLFVVDDIRVGRSFSEVYSLVSASSIKSVTVLKRADAAGYGINGANGVIVINTE